MRAFSDSLPIILSRSPQILIQHSAQVQPARSASRLLAFAVGLGLLAGGSGCFGAREGQGRPSFVLITVDSLRADRVGFSGYAQGETPNIDSLAARGTVFALALTASPDAVPALASLHTGQYPVTHGLRVADASALAPEVVTIAERLEAAGYRTGAITSSLQLHPKHGFGQGFDVYRSGFEETPRPSQVLETGIRAERTADWALEFLETARDGPFLLWVNFFDLHAFSGSEFEHDPPEPYASRFAGRLYDGEAAHVDHEVGRILGRLKEFGLERSTVVILAGTSGEGLGDHGEAYHGVTLQHATTRVPLVVSTGTPERPSLPAGGRVETPVSLVDLAPTILDLAGLPPLEGADGISLAGARDPARPVYLETRLPERMFGWSPLTGVVSGTRKYVMGARAELFDLAADPGETRDLSPSEPAERDRLAGLAKAYEQRARAPSGLASEVMQRISALGLSVDPASREAAKDPRDWVALANDAIKADRSLKRGKVQAAWFLFSGVMGKDPDNHIALLDTAVILAGQRQRDQALNLLRRARDLYPTSGEIYHQMGHVISALPAEGGAQHAGELFKIAADLDPLNEEALYDVACGLAASGEVAPALDALDRAVDQGFQDFKWMARDKDLDSVRTDPRFTSITGGKAEPPEGPPAPQPK